MRCVIVIIVMAIFVLPATAQVTTAEVEEKDASPPVAPASSQWTLLVNVNGGLLPSSIALFGLPGIASCCPSFTQADGWMLSVNAGSSYSLSDKLSVEGRLGFALLNPTTSDKEIVPLNDNFQTVDGSILHEIDLSVMSLDIRLGVAVELLDRLDIMIAPSIMIPLSSTFTQTESLESPKTVEFINGERSWHNADGSVATNAAVASIGGGARYLFEIGESLSVGPEIWYDYALSDLVTDWRINRLTVGVTLSGL